MARAALTPITLVCVLLATACSNTDPGVSAARSESIDRGAEPAEEPAPDDEPAAPPATEQGDEPAPAGSPEGSLPSEIPLDPAAIAAPTDPAAMLTSLGFPVGWPVPDLAGGEAIVGVEIRVSTGTEGISADYTTAYRVASGSPDTVAEDWLGRIDATFGTGPTFVEGTTNDGTLESVTRGDIAFSVNAIHPVGDTTSPIDLEIEFEDDLSDPVDTFVFPGELGADLPDLSGCVPELTIVDFDQYQGVGDLSDDAYRLVFDGNCDETLTVALLRDWVTAKGVALEGDEEQVNVDAVPGPLGFTYDVYAGTSDDGTTYVRIEAVHPL